MTNILEEKLQEVLSLNWSLEDKEVLYEALKSIISFKRFIPNAVINQILKCIDICIREKRELDALRE